jgi:hypothetical protein
MDIGGGQAPVPCTTSGAVICEDFEGDLNTAVWNHVTTSGASTVSRDASRAHRGSYSLHIHLDGTQMSAALGHVAVPTNLPNDVYVRAFVYLPGSPLPPAGVPENLMSLVSLDGSAGALLSRDATSALYLTDYGPAGSGNWTSPNSAFPSTPAWTCLEWHIHATRANVGDIGVSMNGAAAGLTEASVQLPTFDQLSFAVAFQEAPGSDFDAWFDDIYVDGSPVGCSK